MSHTCFTIIYIAGLVLIPVGFGMWRHDVVRRWEMDDYLLACFILVIWPISALFGVCIAGTFVILFGIAHVFRWFFEAGVRIRTLILNLIRVCNR